MTLYIRTEANRVTATGHMMRCLAIADAAAEKGIRTVFIVAEEGSERFPRERGYQTICLGRRWDDFTGEIPVIEKLIADQHVEVMLLDSYFVSEDYMKAVTKMTRTAYIDDLHAAIWSCGILIDYAVYYDLFDYQKEYPDTKLLLGCGYAPLRKEFKDLPVKQISKTVKRVLVVTGGTDEYHFMRGFVEALLSQRNLFAGVEFTLICGAFNREIDEIRKLSADYLAEAKTDAMRIRIYSSLPTLKDAMLETDLLITAGGTTLYEMAACGTPGICFSMADNQLDNVKGFAVRDLVWYAGDIRKDFSFDHLIEMMKELMQDYAARDAVSKKLRALVDGKGAERIVDAVIHYRSGL
ncbi:MAG: UDP-2,4-diacetamido-2,4,6-trideoxy-beta-L-altropyranose hydrolase [Lachnospiraceae bacterium]|nr:UDP-2,4-diacetamido-2,4,6-trideoxy-beta-L-altropyranose hydrolase [Lachnospiraceae bacterium]